MKQAFDQSFESHLYWLGERAIEESPGKYREILEFMDDWTIATLAKIPPEPFDYPGWARDFAQHPAHPEQVFVFDRYGRIFFYNGNKLKWIFAPDKLIPDEIFDEEFVANNLLKDFTPQKPQGIFATGKHTSMYYRAILQNLFFATLNQEMGKLTGGLNIPGVPGLM